MNNMTLIPVKENIIRCVYHPNGLIADAGTLYSYPGKQNPDPGKTDLDVCIEQLESNADPETGEVIFRGADGELLLHIPEMEFTTVPVLKYTTGGEKPVIERVVTVDGERNFIKNLRSVEDHTALHGRIFFRFEENEAIHGFGQGEEGIYNLRGHNRYLYQHNMRIPMPVLLSNKCYAFVFDCGCLMTFEDTENGSYLYFDALQQIDFYFIYGKNFDELISGIRFLTGKASMLPKWAFGYIQSKEHYHTAKELADIACKYRELDVPLDCVVQDWNTWEPGKWGQKTLDSKRYDDVEEQMKVLKDLHVHTMVSVWPNCNSGTKNHTEFERSGTLLNDYSTYNAFDEKAREIYFRQAKEGLFDRGFDAWWCDSTEPFSGPDWNGPIKREPWERFFIVGTEHKKYLPAEKANLYSLFHARGMYENQRKVTEEKRVLNLTRSGYAGSQQYGAVLWSGDITASWAVMKKQIAEGLNMVMSGYPYWTLDIGGFFTVGKKWQNRGCGCNTDPSPRWFWKGEYDEGVKDRGYCELYTRWLQFGAFLPMFRSHGTDTPREIWNFGERGTPFFDAIEKQIRLRYQLIPYLYSIAASVWLNDSVIIRPLLFDFPQDEKAAALSTEYLFGHSILVNPVTKPMYYLSGDREIIPPASTVWETYLPSGIEWVEFYSGLRFSGGQTVSTEAPLDRIPLFIRAGTILPMQKGLHYTSEDTGYPLEIHVYTGTNADFVLYEDAGDGYGYENGEYAVISLHWDDKAGSLTIDERAGCFPGMKEYNEMEVFLNGKKAAVINYYGKKVVLKPEDVLQ